MSGFDYIADTNAVVYLLAVMQASLEEYKALWLQYQKDIKYIDG